MKTNYKFYKDHRFLVVDDDQRLRDQAIGVLIELGFIKENILSAENGEEAFKLVKDDQNKIEFFVIDLVMPIMNGIDLLKALSTLEHHKNTPKLVLSSESDANIILNAVAAGANSYLNKPCEKFTMAKKLFECVSK
ncbi:MAG: response regulator [Halobacteriovoraceae bacterium]|jgi:CheY-like chemotaxis protein|nr:response regulator [Halobacteriovoraceae bacterium]